MGISRLDAMVIQSHPDSNLIIGVAQHKKTYKWSAWLYLLRDGVIHRPIISTDDIYESEEIAREEMSKTVKTIREMGDDIFKEAVENA